MAENYNNNSLAENKVLILYTLNTLKKELTSSDLFKIISVINDINYFYFSDILNDLVESKLLETYSKDEKTIYKLTSEGINSLDLTVDILPGILKLKADNTYKNEITEIAEEQSITAEYIPENEKDYTVKCKILENNKIVFELTTFAGSNEQAKRIADNWKNNANVIYPQIISLINK